MKGDSYAKRVWQTNVCDRWVNRQLFDNKIILVNSLTNSINNPEIIELAESLRVALRRQKNLFGLYVEKMFKGDQHLCFMYDYRKETIIEKTARLINKISTIYFYLSAFINELTLCFYFIL